MCIEIVEDHPNHFGLRISMVNEPLHLICKVCFGSPLCDFDMPPSCLRLTEDKQVSRPLALILIVITLRPPASRLRLDARVSAINCLLVSSKLTFGRFSSYCSAYKSKYILHRRYKHPIDFRYAPLLFQPRLQFVFLSTRCTVSSEHDSVSFNSTTRSASNCKVQCSRPSGAFEQASAIRRASPFSSSSRFLPGRGRSWSDPSLTSTKRLRVRSTVGIQVSSSWAISSSRKPKSAFSKMCARVSLRAECFPRRSICSSVERS